MPLPIKVLILGAASGIAEATARLYAQEGAIIGIAGRNIERLNQIASDLRIRGAERVEIFEADFLAADPVSTLTRAKSVLGGLDHVLLAYGVLGDQSEAEQSLEAACNIIDVDFRSAAAWSLATATLLEQQGNGSLVVLGSVAGDRGRRSNYIYGAAKGGLGILVQGISHRFANKGPRAVIVKPGPTDTAMTKAMTKGGPLWASPETVAKIVRRAAERGGPVVYAPARWRLIMLVIRSIPSVIFNKMNF